MNNREEVEWRDTRNGERRHSSSVIEMDEDSAGSARSFVPLPTPDAADAAQHRVLDRRTPGPLAADKVHGTFFVMPGTPVGTLASPAKGEDNGYKVSRAVMRGSHDADARQFTANREQTFSHDADFPASFSSKPRVSRTDSSGEYVGSYGKLVHFFQECRENEVIDEDRYNDLLKSVEDINRHGEGQELDTRDEFFQGDQDAFKKFLPAFGIAASGSTVRRACSTKMTIRNSSVLREANELALHLSDPGFQSGLRGDVEADARLMLYGLSAPYDLVDRYHLDTGIVSSWIGAIARQYLDNPYHNWQHAVDVYQFCYMTLISGGAVEHFNYQDILALLLASIAHDVGHPGTNNAFLVNSSAKLAITYNDRSPLENMHASIFFETLSRPGMNFLEHLAEHDAKVFRSKVIDGILATDMAHHFELVDRFSARLMTIDDNPFVKDTKDSREKQKASQEDRRMLIQMFIHMADLGNCCRPWDVHKHLVVALEEEFFAQGDQERELNLPIMPMMDRRKDSAATSQGFFLEKLVSPLVDPCTRFMNRQLADVLRDNILGNKRRWQALIEKHGKKTAAELLPLDDGDSNKSDWSCRS